MLAQEAGLYFGRQMLMLETFTSDSISHCGDPEVYPKAWKKLFRNGVPDKFKRESILAFFKINPEAAEN